MTASEHTRRGFLAGTICLAVGGVLPVRNSHGTEHVSSALAGLYPCRKSAAEVGRRYLQQAPQEDNEATLVSGICAGHDPLRRAVDSASLRAFIRERVKTDFETGATVVVGGWVLARTEARLCALTYLHSAVS